MNFLDFSNSMSRRRFLRNLALTGLAVSGGSGMLYATAVEPFLVEVVNQRIALPGLKEGLRGLRAAQLSDLHMGLFISRDQLQNVVSMTLEQKPEIVFITGDSLTVQGDSNRALADLESALSVLSAQVPVYAIYGNHDLSDRPASLRKLYEKLNIQLLVNDLLPFHRNGDVLYIAGLDSLTAGRPQVARLAAAVPADQTAVLMAHEPDIADRTARTGKFALQISGHTHGGQVNLPLFGPLVLPEEGRKYAAGLYHVGEMLLYTNRGIGMMHLPVRINCPPEITIFTFEPAA
jgi:predicted MPP superfamily phosphohydrolase